MRRRSIFIRLVPAMASIALAVGGGPSGAGAIYRAVLGSPVARTHLGGTQWRFGRVPLPAEVIGLAAVSCGSQRSCLAIGSTDGIDTVLLRSTDGGLHWTERPDPAGIGNFSAVSCVSARRCMATTSSGFLGFSPSGVAISADGGLTWRPERSIPAARSGYWGVVRCLSASVCYVFNAQARSYLTGGIERTTDFGEHWTTEHVSGPMAGAINGVLDASCVLPSACVAAGQWSRGGKLSPMLATSDGGSTWHVHVAPTAAPDLEAVSCGSTRDCVAAGGSGDGADAVASTDGGVTWRRAAGLPAFGIAWAATCTGARTCLLVGETASGLANNGVVARTTDLGRHWTVTRTTRGGGILSAVSCPSAAHCVAGRESDGAISPTPAGSQGFDVSNNGGSSWRQVGLPLTSADLQSVACPGASVCFAVGGTAGPADDAVVLRSRDGGRTWRVVLVSGRLQTLSDISCPTTAECVAVGVLNYGTGNAIVRTDDGGRRWRVAAPPAGVRALSDVSCPTAAFCEVLGRATRGGGLARLLRSTDGGRRWQVSKPPRGVAYLLGLSCATSRVCAAVGDGVSGGPIIVRTTDGGLRWIRQRPPRGAMIVESVSCPGTLTCYALNDTVPITIEVTHDGGAHWASQRLPGPGDELPSDISCATSRMCAGVAMIPGISGAIFETTNGRSWRQATLPADTDDLLGITCGRRGCVAVGIDGQVLLSGAGG